MAVTEGGEGRWSGDGGWAVTAVVVVMTSMAIVVVAAVAVMFWF